MRGRATRPSARVQGPPDHRGVLGDEGPHHGDGRVDLGLQRPSVRPRGRRGDRLRRLRDRLGLAARAAPVPGGRLLAGGVDGRRVRHDGSGRHAREIQGALRGLDLGLRRRARGRLPRLAVRRAHAVDPLDHEHATRALLLGHRAQHLRARDRRGRPHRDDLWPRLLLGGGAVRRPHLRAARAGAWWAGIPSRRSGSPTSSRARSARRTRTGSASPPRWAGLASATGSLAGRSPGSSSASSCTSG